MHRELLLVAYLRLERWTSNLARCRTSARVVPTCQALRQQSLAASALRSPCIDLQGHKGLRPVGSVQSLGVREWRRHPMKDTPKTASLAAAGELGSFGHVEVMIVYQKNCLSIQTVASDTVLYPPSFCETISLQKLPPK